MYSVPGLRTNKVQEKVWFMFCQIALELVEHKVDNDLETSTLEWKMYRMSAEELSNSDDEAIIDYINAIDPYIIWDWLDQEKDDEPNYDVLW